MTSSTSLQDFQSSPTETGATDEEIHQVSDRMSKVDPDKVLEKHRPCPESTSVSQCATFEKDMLCPETKKQSSEPHFEHYLYFQQISMSAALRCELSSLLENGLLHKLVENPPSSDSILSIKDPRQFLLHLGTWIADEDFPGYRISWKVLKLDHWCHSAADFDLWRVVHKDKDEGWEPSASFSFYVSKGAYRLTSFSQPRFVLIGNRG